MTYPDSPRFEDRSSEPNGESVDMESTAFDAPETESFIDENPYPKPVFDLPDDKEDACSQWLDDWIDELESSWDVLRTKWAAEEEAYRAKSLGPQNIPFVGACGDVVPAIAMAVDPIYSRLNAVTKQKPMLQPTGLRNSVLPYMNSFRVFLQFYFTHINPLRSVLAPRFLESAKHGTMALKITYDKVQYDVQGYNAKWEPEKITSTLYAGPRISGVELGDLMFPPHYQHLQDSPVVVERHRVTLNQINVWAASGKISKEAVDKIKNEYDNTKTATEEEVETSNDHREHTLMDKEYYILHEVWCDYDIDGDGLPERLAFLYHKPTRTYLMRRYNWYFHQKKPYVVAPYMLANDTLLGLGLCETLLPFQDMLTAWHRHATNNAFIANTRMWVTTKGSSMEDKPKLVANRVFRADNPDKDLRPLQMGDIYPSTLSERQNLFGLMEKRSGVSDYLTGRESPIIGSRATATATTALIQEGTKRVEEVLDNKRAALSEAVEMCLYIWVQYGLGEISDIAFGDDKVGTDMAALISSLTRQNVSGAVAFDLAAADAANNKNIQQQMQLAIIQQMMTYYTKLIESAQLAVQTAQQAPPVTALITETMSSARKLFLDLLQKYDVPNTEDYLPKLEDFINALQPTTPQPPPAGAGGEQAGADGTAGLGGLPPDIASLLGAAGGGAGAPQAGDGTARPVPSAGAATSL